jgi:hypothetical protein
MVSAWACQSRLVLQQKKVDDKSNERSRHCPNSWTFWTWRAALSA